jgi:hypothetical protein
LLGSVAWILVAWLFVVAWTCNRQRHTPEPMPDFIKISQGKWLTLIQKLSKFCFRGGKNSGSTRTHKHIHTHTYTYTHEPSLQSFVKITHTSRVLVSCLIVYSAVWSRAARKLKLTRFD